MEPRFPLPAEPPQAAGQTGHRAEEIQDVHLRERLFLAWARGPLGRERRRKVSGEFELLQDTEDEQGVLGTEDPAQQGAGQRGGAETGGDGVVQHHHLGMPTEGQEDPATG